MPTRRAFASLAFTSLAFIPALLPRAEAEPQAPTRAEVPVKLVVMPDGAHRYTVPIKVGDTTIEAGLDTGSVGLRILPGTLKPGDAKSNGQPEQAKYGGGAMLEGTLASATLDIGGLKGEASVELIDKVGCTPRAPDCPAGKIPIADYGLMGNGLAGAGFKAIMGVGPRRIAIDNPFRQVGATRFIVDLPRDKNETGRIILNPSPGDLEGFITIPPYERTPAQTQLTEDAIAGCLVDEGTGKKICGAMTFDSGAPAIKVVSPDPLGEAWADGTKARGVIEDGAGHELASSDVVVGPADGALHMVVQRMEFLPKTIVRMGIAPYRTFSVFYDLDRAGLALKPRAPRG